MKKEDLIRKWLDFDLTEDELEAFKKLDTSNSYFAISEAAQHFKAPSFDATSNFKLLKEQLSEVKKEKISWLRYTSSIAAVFAIGFLVYFAFFNTRPTTYYAENAARQEVILPDASAAVLNAGSQLTFDNKNWSDNRNVSLDGEAYFKVAKGQKFTVKTDQGSVAVLGTQFNVKSRPGYFEVSCYEGLVEVQYQGNNIQLLAGTVFRAQGTLTVKEESGYLQPPWTQHKSTFKSVPVSEVLDEIERQYNVTILASPIKKNTIFTGSFTHENLETALQSVIIPFDLSYEIQDQVVTLSSNN